jgi:type II secretory pathway pseudopilin PulG
MSVGPKRNGSTLVEVVTVMLVISILTRIAIPQMQNVLTRARATEIRASFGVVEEAATRLSVENNPWPQDAEAGVVPPELQDALPEGFSFDRERYQLDWENWSLPQGMPGGSNSAWFDRHFRDHFRQVARPGPPGRHPSGRKVQPRRNVHVHFRHAVAPPHLGSLRAHLRRRSGRLCFR